MSRPWLVSALFLALAFAEGKSAESSEISRTRDDYSEKPAVEILMHLPPEFEDVGDFLSYFRGANARVRGRRKRDATEKAEEAPVASPLRDDIPIIPMLDVASAFSAYGPLRPEGVSSVNDDEDRVQRDKRTFMDGQGERETTTAPPYWKRKKESPPFVTGRDSSAQKVGNYQPAQHRSVDNARESHSMKDLDKTVLSNEITRGNQDNYFSSTNRRAYNSRQAEGFTPRTPKSVYDTIDANRRRSYDPKRQTSEKPNQEQQFARQYTYPRPYDRPYYPVQGDVVGRGIEYYHRTFDPASGRIIYYANVPDPSRHYDPTYYGDPTGRSIYVNGRTYLYDPYGRSYIYPNDYRLPSGYGRSDYVRSGRSSAEVYPAGDTRNARYNGFDRSRDDFRNRTYVIFDAEESGTQGRRFQPPFPPPDFNRFAYPVPPPYAFPFGSAPLPGPPPPAYPNYRYRNQFYPTPQTPLPWTTSQKPSNFVTKPFNVPEVQLPLNTRNRSLYPDYDKMKKN